MSVAVIALAALACIALGAWWLGHPTAWLRRLSRGPAAASAPSGFKLVLTRLCGALLIAAGGAVLALLFMPVPP